MTHYIDKYPLIQAQILIQDLVLDPMTIQLVIMLSNLFARELFLLLTKNTKANILHR